MSKCLHFLLKGSSDEERFLRSCHSVFQKRPFRETEELTNEYTLWCIPDYYRPWSVYLFPRTAFISSNLDWDFLWEQDYREDVLRELGKFLRIFNVSEAFVLPETICYGLLDHLPLNLGEDLDAMLQQLLGPPSPLTDASLHFLEENGLERQAYFHYNRVLPPLTGNGIS